MNCSACNCTVNSAHSYLKCSQCQHKFHIQCLNISREQFLSLTEVYRSKWLCPSCNNITRRNRSNLNTPVRHTQVPTNEVSMDMSFDIHTPDRRNSQDTANNEVTMDKISALLDQKLNTSLSIFKDSFRSALREDVKNLVRSEMDAVTTRLKEEFTSTTDFICSEQSKLQSDIEKKASVIKKLEVDNLRLQADINIITNRLNSMERMSRNHNLEIQAVPENKNENILALFKKLCQSINQELEDGNILSCRRVAKLNASSSRPRNILVTLSSPRLRDALLSACHRFNKAHKEDNLNTNHLGLAITKQRIFVTEHLSPESKILHAATRKSAKEKNYKYVWVKYGRVYVRKDDSAGCIYIKNMESLEKLK